MEYEIELKLMAPNNAGDLIEEKLLPSLSYPVTKTQVELSNYYFDTAERTLRKHDIGLRIRGNGNQLEQTLKTAGKSLGGLHQRPEYNVQLPDKIANQQVVPNLALFDSSAWPKDFDLCVIQQNITTLFATNFVRKIYLFDVTETTQIEMVWDLGSVSANGQSVAICEIELELKKGDVAEIFILAKQLLQIMCLSLGGDSKAARGYRLADNLVVPEPKIELTTEIEYSDANFVSLVEKALLHWQYYANQLAKHYSDNYAEKISLSLNNLTFIFQRKLVNHDTLEHDMLELKRLNATLLTFTHNWQLIIEKIKQADKLKSEQSVEAYQAELNSRVFQSEVTQLQLNILQFLFNFTSYSTR